MNNIGTHIVSEQNKPGSIDMLAAMRKLYSVAKKLFYIQTIIVTIIPVVLAIYSVIDKKTTEEYAWIFLTYTITAGIIELILNYRIDYLKKTAAGVQEQFDTNVLTIPWNYVEIPIKPDNRMIFRYAEKEKKITGINDLIDWYSPVIGTVNTNIATIICQRTNCTYDFTLRKKYTFWLKVLFIVVLLTLFLIWAWNDKTIISFIVQVLAPSSPLFFLAYKQIENNTESIAKLNELKVLIETTLQNATHTTIVPIDLIRSIQNKIYYNRIVSPLLPDWIFKRLRGKLESEMHYDVQILVNNLS